MRPAEDPKWADQSTPFILKPRSTLRDLLGRNRDGLENWCGSMLDSAHADGHFASV